MAYMKTWPIKGYQIVTQLYPLGALLSPMFIKDMVIVQAWIVYAPYCVCCTVVRMCAILTEVVKSAVYAR